MTWVGDFNGDGLTDIASRRGSVVYMSISTGTNFKSENWYTNNQWGNPEDTWVGDFNGDGLTDIASLDKKEGTIYLKLSTGSGFENKTYTDNGLWETPFKIGDFNGDGLTDIASAYFFNVHMRLAKKATSNFITTITAAHGATITIDYKPLTDNSIYTKDDDAIYPEMDFQKPIYVVASYKTSNGIGGENEIQFRYGGAKTNLHGRGFRGFRWVEKIDQQTGISTKTYYEQDHKYTGSHILKAEQHLADGTLISEVNNTLAFNDFGGKGVYFAFVKSSETKSYDLDGSFIASVTSENQYDDYGNITKVIVNHHDGYSETTTNIYLNDTSNWFLGRLTKAVINKTVKGQSTQTRTSTFEYDSASGLLNKKVIEPDHASLRVEKIYQHDAYGNIIQSTTNGAGIESRSYVTRYDDEGRFVIESQNALGHKETRIYQRGNLVSLTDPNHFTTVWEYDGFGRQILEKRANNTETRKAYRLCTKESKCPDNAVYYVHTATSGMAATIVYYDMLDREVRLGTNGFDNRAIYVDTQYNERGLVEKVSAPYFVGETPVWNVNEFDVLRRIVKQTIPDNSVTTTNYKGFTTIVTNPLGQTNTRTVNTRKQLIESKDNLKNTITYLYDGFGNLLELRDSANNVTQMQYDLRGNKIRMSDPDTGTSTYIYNALGELKVQTDAKEQTVRMQYDQLGRLIERQESEGVSTWIYDTQSKGIGKLAKLHGPNGYEETYSYDSFGRLAETITKIDGQHYTISKTYDQYGRADSLTYPTGFAVRNFYNSNGYLAEIRRVSDNFVYWRADKLNARGQIEQVSLGNGLVTQKVYDHLTGRIQQIQTSGAQDLRFTFDRIDNLTQRTQGNLVENFRYDELNRLTQTSVVGGKTVTMAYDVLGNITYKSDVDNYSYGTRPHAVTAVSGVLNNQYSYDAKGNRISSAMGTVAYTSFNKPHTITEGKTKLQFQYGPNYSRYRQTVIKKGVTTSVKTYIGGVYEQEITKETTQKIIYPSPHRFPTRWRNTSLRKGRYYSSRTTKTFTKDIHYIFIGAENIAIDTKKSDGKNTTRYLHKDHLGSIDAITDEQGALVENLSFDAWGNRRTDGWQALTEKEMRALLDEGLPTPRGFTGHEHLDEVQLIHMNGRVYDPVIGRFLSADPFVQAPSNTQSLNRYSYVLNNPLTLIDPSGYESGDINDIDISLLGLYNSLVEPILNWEPNIQSSLFFGNTEHLNANSILELQVDKGIDDSLFQGVNDVFTPNSGSSESVLKFDLESPIHLATLGINTPYFQGQHQGSDGLDYNLESPYGEGLRTLGIATLEGIGISMVSSGIHSEYYDKHIDSLFGFSGGVFVNANLVSKDKFSGVTEFRAYGNSLVSADMLQQHGVSYVDYYVPSPVKDPAHFILGLMPNDIKISDDGIYVGWKFTYRFGPDEIRGPKGWNWHFYDELPFAK